MVGILNAFAIEYSAAGMLACLLLVPFVLVPLTKDGVIVVDGGLALSVFIALLASLCCILFFKRYFFISACCMGINGFRFSVFRFLSLEMSGWNMEIN